MAKTVEEYKDFLGYEFLSLIHSEGWDNLIDNIVDYEDIDYPDESERGTILYEVAEKVASDKYEAEVVKVIEAIKLYLEEAMQTVTGDVWKLEAVAS